MRFKSFHHIVVIFSLIFLSACTDDEVTTPNMLVGSGSTQPAPMQTAIPVDEIDPDFLEQFYGIWYSKEEQGIVLNITEKNLSIGYEQGELITDLSYTILDANPANLYLVVTGELEEIMLGEDATNPEQAKFRARLTLQNDGFHLTYDNQYLGEQIISEWQRSPAEFDSAFQFDEEEESVE